MKKSVNVGWGALKVGILLILVTIILFWASFTGGGTSIFTPKSEFICYFPDVNGMVKGSPVWMSGVEVGNVTNVEFVLLDPQRQVKVTCRVEDRVWNVLTDSATVSLGTIGFLGDKYVAISPGLSGGEPIAKGAVIPTENVPGASDLFASGQEAFTDMGAIVTDLDTLLRGINSGKGTLGLMATDKQLYRQMTALLGQLTALTADLQKNQERIVSSIEKTGNAIDQLGNKVTENTGTIGRLMNDPELYDNLAATSANLDSILAKIESAEGTLGLMVSDTAMYVEMVNLMNRASNLIADIEANPRRYFKFSVF